MWLALVVVLLAIAAAGGQWFFVGRFVESTDDAYVGGDVTVMAPKVGGFISQVLVHDNQRVSRDQVLVQLDARDYEARLAQAGADVRGAEATVNELVARKSLQGATISQQAASVRASSAELTRSGLDATRYRELVKDDAVSNQLVERSVADVAKARAEADRSSASLLAAGRQIDVLEAQIGDARAHVETARAAERIARLNMEYTTLRAPIDGYVGNRSARIGMLAAVGTSLMTVVPSSGLWIDANFKEDQLREIRVGDAADVYLDASGKRLHGTVESIAPATGATFSILPAENATGNFTRIVQRVPVRIHVEATPAEALDIRPGLSATVKVHLAAKAARSAS